MSDATTEPTTNTPTTPNDADAAATAVDSEAGTGGGGVDTEAVKKDILEALKVVRDPEIPVNVVDLGLIYGLAVDENGKADIEMTLTSPGCPVQDMIQADAELAAMKVEGVNRVKVEFVWSPPWSPEKMTDDGKKQMRMFGFNL